MRPAVGDLLAYLPAAAALAVGWYQLRPARGRRFPPGSRPLCLFGLCMGAAMAVLAPATAAAAARVLPTAATAWPHLLGRQLEMAALCALALAAAELGLPDSRRLPARWHPWVTVAVCAAATACFLVSRATVEEGAITVPGTAGRAALVAFDVLFTLYSLWSLALFALPVHAQVRRSGPGPFRTGLRLVTASACLGGLWAVWGLAGVANMARTGRQGAGQDPVALALGGACLVLAGLGATAARWGGALTAPARWLRAYRSYRALEPLWSALHTAVPGIALRARTRRPAWLPPRSAEFALYRRVIEIRDGYLALRPYAPRCGTFAVGRAGDGEGAETEAAAVAAALDAARGGVRPDARTRDAVGTGPRPAVRPVRGTVDAEAAWLVRVAEAFARSAGDAAAERRATRARATAGPPLTPGRERAPASAPGRKD